MGFFNVPESLDRPERSIGPGLLPGWCLVASLVTMTLATMIERFMSCRREIASLTWSHLLIHRPCSILTKRWTKLWPYLRPVRHGQ